MCGINGIYCYRDQLEPIDRNELLGVRDHMAPRGPDGFGEWISDDARIGLGHRRLAIIDLSTSGLQPMQWDNGRYQIVFNGEIYNYAELRKELANEGAVFRSTSDTEVLLALYARHGADILSYIRGMYAFAIWDEREQTLFLARDPYGIKPLYYSDNGKYFRFASQVKPLEASGAISMDVDSAGLVGFLLWGAVPEPFTIRKAIRALPAGHYLVVKKGRVHEPRRFFNLSSPLPRKKMGVIEALTDSVRAHLVSDVQVAIYLSAGLDSSLIAALASRILPEPPVTFTLVFDHFSNTGLDEGPIAKQIAEVLGTQHIERKIGSAEFVGLWPQLIAAMDQPSIDGFNTYLVSKVAHEQGIKVALSGLGGDEIFGGYGTFSDVPKWVRMARLGGCIPGLAKGWPFLSRFFADTRPKIAGFMEYAHSLPSAYFLRRGIFLPHELPRILEPEIVRDGLAAYDPCVDACKCLNPRVRPDQKLAAWEAIHLMESTQYLLNQLLRDSDWASMAHSLELRVPLVDHWLRDSVAAANFEPARTLGRKALVKQLVPELPEAVWNRSKSGFFVPVMPMLLDSKQKGQKWGVHSRSLVLEVLKAFGISGEFSKAGLQSICTG